MEILIPVHFMKDSYLERPREAGNPYPGAFYERQLPGKAFEKLDILIPVHFMKGNRLERLPRSWKSLFRCILRKATTWKGSREAGNPYPGAFYEGHLPGKAPREAENPYPGAFYEGRLPGKAPREAGNPYSG